jgi:hypothetical protein
LHPRLELATFAFPEAITLPHIYAISSAPNLL